MGAIQVVSLLIAGFIVISDAQVSNKDKKVVCYFTNWSYKRAAPFKFTPKDVDPFLCTHIIYAFVDIGNRNNLKPSDPEFDINQRGFRDITALKKQNTDLKIMISIGGWANGALGFARITSNDTNRKEFAKNAVRFMRGYQFDGLDMNWQHPTFREGGGPEDRENYVFLAQTLRDEFEREARSKNRPRLLLSIAISNNEKFLPAYDLPNFNNYMDLVNVICYDYYFSYESAVAHHSPLFSLEEDTDYNYDAKININYTISYFSEAIDSEKLVMGIPTYGRTYKLVRAEDTEIGAFADGPGEASKVTGEKGWLPHFEICNFIKNENWEVVQTKPGFAGPYAHKGLQWVCYDDIQMIKTKAAYANQRNLGGVMFWTIDYDDFFGRCDNVTFPLIRAARSELLHEEEPMELSGKHMSEENNVDKPIEEPTYVAPPKIKPKEEQPRVVPNPTPVQPRPPPKKPVATKTKPTSQPCSNGRQRGNDDVADDTPDIVMPRDDGVDEVQTNIVNNLLRIIEKAGGMSNFCKLLQQDKRMHTSIVSQRGLNSMGENENTVVFETPNLPPILLVLSNSSVYIKEVNIHNRSN